MDGVKGTERIETVIIGGGQAGLAVGHHLARRNRPFVILEANDRIGDSWRKRWDSLRLFTPARHDALPGMRFPAPGWSFPTRDEMADYLESYAERFALPVRTRVAVDGVSKHGDSYVVSAGDRRFEAGNVVVASGPYQIPKVPEFASELDPSIVQLHSLDYRGPSQLREGGLLVVGAGNSGADIAVDASNRHETWLAGRDPGHIPFPIEGVASRVLLERLVVGFAFRFVLTTNTPIGRKVRPKILSKGGPLIRLRPKDIVAAAIHTVGRVAGVKDGLPVLDDGRVLDVANVVWCTGFKHDFSWIDLPIFEDGEPVQRRGIAEGAPGVYFVGLHFLYAMSSAMVHGVGRDAEHIAKHIATRATRGRTGDRVAA